MHKTPTAGAAGLARVQPADAWLQPDGPFSPCFCPLLALLLTPTGNPVSGFVCFNLVVTPALRKMAGWAQPQLRRLQVVTTRALKLDPERPEYHRVVLQYGRWVVTDKDWHTGSRV
jgi:hypothetical protein